jgi:hypothetical protein
MAKRRRHQGSRAGLEVLRQQLEANGVSKGRKVIFRANDKGKLSEAILMFIEPYKGLAPTYAAYSQLIALAIVAWNAALVEGQERQDMLDRFLGVIVKSESEKVRAEFRQLVNELIERKERYFSKDKRYVAGYHLSETKENYHLSVASLESE